MALFQSVRKFYGNMGLANPSQTQQKCQFNRRIFSILLIMSLIFLSMANSFLFEATTVTEYAESFYVSLTVFACIMSFLTSFWKRENIYTFVEKLEKYSENRKLKNIFHVDVDNDEEYVIFMYIKVVRFLNSNL